MSDPVIEQLAAQVAALPKQGRPLGLVSKPREITYKCDCCGEVKTREELYARQVRFLNMATKQQARARIVDWICVTCMVNHPDYCRQFRLASPEFRHAREAAADAET